MRRFVAVLTLGVVFLAAPSASAHFIGDVGFRAAPPTHHHHWHPLAAQTGIPAPEPSPTAQSSYPAILGGGAFQLSAVQVAGYARGAGFPESVVPTMVAIAARESGYNAHAVNLSSGACGLWQLYPCPGIAFLDPATNAAGAFAKYEASGLAPWGF
jgi:hypothetical protein